MASLKKLKKKARKYEKSSELDKAVQMYERMLSVVQEDDDVVELGIYNRIGDLYRRLGKKSDAVDYYEQAADHYAEAGLYNNAIALCNKALRHESSRTDLYLKLGRFSASQGFTTDARRWFLAYAEEMSQRNAMGDAFRALEEFADLSDDPEVRELLASQLKAHGKTDEAVEQLQRAHGQRRAAGDADAAAAVEARIREIDPGAVADLGDGPPDGGAPAADEPAGPAAADDDLAPPDGLPGLGIESAAGAAGIGGSDEPDAVGEDDLEIESAAGSALGSDPVDGPEARAGDDDGDDLPLLDDPLGDDAAEPVTGGGDVGAGADGGDDPLPMLGDDGPGDETDAGAAVGGEDAATMDEDMLSLDGLDADLSAADGGLESDAGGDPEPDGVEGAAPVEGFESDALLGLDDEDALGGADLGGADEASDEEPALGALDGADLDIPAEDAPALDGLETGPPDPLSDAGDPAPMELEGHGSVDMPAPEAETAPAADPAERIERARERAAAGDAAEAADMLWTVQEELADAGRVDDAIEALAELHRIRPDDVDVAQRRVEYASRSADRDRMVAAYEGLARTLSRTGAEMKASAVYQRILDLDPGHPAAQEAVGGGPSPATQQESSSGSGGDYVDLAGMLEDEEEDEPESESTTRFFVPQTPPTGDEEQDFAEMLSQFKTKVSEHMDEGDASSHYDLGLAYKDMGLVDEAIAEFQTVLRNGGDNLKVYEELGDCFMVKEQYKVAVNLLNGAVASDRYAERDLLAILYQLGRCHEALGQRDQARVAYERVIGLDIEFRDVPQRIAKL